MRIGIVNDVSLAVEVLRRTIHQQPGLEIAWVAFDGEEAVRKNADDKADLILMDLLMPVMDGVEATRRIMTENPTAILVVTSTVTGNSGKVFSAMGYGALDAVCTPVFGPGGKIEGARDLLKKIATIGKLIGKENIELVNHNSENDNCKGELPPMVAIGSSTGGPRALADILTWLPGDFPAAVVVVQHVDSQFARGLADWLDDQTSLRVKVIREGDHAEKGYIYIAETNDHVVLDRDRTFYYTPEPMNYHYRPSVNTFFKSLNENWPRRDVAVVLTGMGDDGAKGLLALREAGWHTIAQDKETSVVYGMPGAAARLNAAIEILPVEKIAESIIKNINKKANTNAAK
ncbi:MAG: chemotaxis response regulator protein-glutamate methylesterase [Candidatus Kapaibacterium sp.]